MIKIHFTSGLGNQLFQFFFGESIKLRFKNQNVKYINSLQPPYQLNINDIFDLKKENINLNIDNISAVNKSLKYLLVNYYKILIKLNINKYFKLYSDNCFDPSSLANLKSDFRYLDFYGYWQNHFYFNKYFDSIKAKLFFKKKLNLKSEYNLSHYSDIVGIHVRGGDYRHKKNLKLYYSVNKDYYVSSIKKFQKKLKNPFYVFFTDDYEFLKELIPKLDFPHGLIGEMSNIRKDDFQYLSQCDHFIIPNSTFSLWAAYISNSNKKILISPKKWLKNNKYNFQFINNDWIKI